MVEPEPRPQRAWPSSRSSYSVRKAAASAIFAANAASADKRIGNFLPYICVIAPSPAEESHTMDKTVKDRRKAPLATPTDLGDNARRDIAGAVNALLADSFALYLKTKNFHWHVSGPHFRDYHLLLDEQADQIFATTDPLAERVRKLGGTTLRSVGDVARHQRVLDNDAEYVEPRDMLAELRDDNREMAARMRQAHGVCDGHGDVATAS